MLLDDKSKILLLVERATNDLRKGFPVIIENGSRMILALSPETASEKTIKEAARHGKKRLIITANRANFISGGEYKEAVSCSVNTADITAICQGAITQKVKLKSPSEANTMDLKALKLTKIAELMPSVITVELSHDLAETDVISINSDYIDKYEEIASMEVKEACRTKLTLKGSHESEIIAFRPNIGGREHYAIIIGKPGKKDPLVRVHSSCYTGDLLDSLACDCHDQLHSAIELMAKDGGIILYMLQEGRGIGLVNKLRAYSLKEQGYDTVDANKNLGFEEDERLFLPAAEILKKIGIKKIRLLTNNPRKAEGLEEHGITVTQCVPHIMEANKHNQAYLNTKSKKLGHRF